MTWHNLESLVWCVDGLRIDIEDRMENSEIKNINI